MEHGRPISDISSPRWLACRSSAYRSSSPGPALASSSAASSRSPSGYCTCLSNGFSLCSWPPLLLSTISIDVGLVHLLQLFQIIDHFSARYLVVCVHNLSPSIPCILKASICASIDAISFATSEIISNRNVLRRRIARRRVDGPGYRASASVMPSPLGF